MSDTPPITGSVGDLGFPSKESLENAIARDNGLGNAGALDKSNVVSLQSGKAQLNKTKDFMSGVMDIGRQIITGDHTTEATERGQGSGLSPESLKLAPGNIAFMALGGAMIIAGIWMLGGGGALAQDAAKTVGIKNARVTG